MLGALLGVSTAFAFYQVSTEQRSLRAEFERRVATLAEGLVEAVRQPLAKNAEPDLRRIVQRNSNQERLLGMAIYDEAGKRIAATDIERLTQPFDAFNMVQQHPRGIGEIVRAGDKALYWFALPVYEDQRRLGVVAVVCDASEIEAQSQRILRDTTLHTARRSARAHRRRADRAGERRGADQAHGGVGPVGAGRKADAAAAAPRGILSADARGDRPRAKPRRRARAGRAGGTPAGRERITMDGRAPCA